MSIDSLGNFRGVPPEIIHTEPQIDIKTTSNIRAEGVRCPRCQCGHCPALYTRHYRQQTVRKRKCSGCGKEFRTGEQIVSIDQK